MRSGRQLRTWCTGPINISICTRIANCNHRKTLVFNCLELSIANRKHLHYPALTGTHRLGGNYANLGSYMIPRRRNTWHRSCSLV